MKAIYTGPLKEIRDSVAQSKDGELMAVIEGNDSVRKGEIFLNIQNNIIGFGDEEFTQTRLWPKKGVLHTVKVRFLRAHGNCHLIPEVKPCSSS